MNPTARRICYVFLCAFPFMVLPLAGARALRVPGLHEVAGVVVCFVSVCSAWILGAHAIGEAGSPERRLAMAGALLVAPFSVVSLFWVGIGAPFRATAPENHMRYLVILANAIIVAGAFVVLKEELADAGERFYSTIGFAASIPAGTAYVVCVSMSLAGSVLVMRAEPKTPSAAFLNEFYSGLEFVACVMTYLATAAFAASLGRVRWLGSTAARTYAGASAVLLLLVVIGGVSYPEISGRTAPWYTQPGVIARIPAIPWIMPCLLGVVLLRRAGDERFRRVRQDGPEDARSARP